MRRAVVVPVLALMLGACATKPPADTATDANATAATPSSSSSSSASTGPRAPVDPNAGRNVATLRSAPGETSVYFEFDSSVPAGNGNDVVVRNAEYVASAPRPVRIEGNADERGSREYNIALGQRRAEAVARMMTLRGVDASRIEAVSNGEEKPRCADRSEDCFAQNRRADILYAK